ncbi:hypothetical protein [Streptomyces sp. NPDC052496]|uniref:RICIN domain-containing protein n=1 Tax=Streptomyces sp. NPDC052496 TaxID=3154951 RepID=UPI00343D3E3C
MPDISAQGINGPFMLIHEVTGTYLETDNYHDALGQGIQTWNLDPLLTNKGQLGHLWYIEPVGDGTHLIKSYENSHCLAASAARAGGLPVLETPDKGVRQKWEFRKVLDFPGHEDSYAIVSKAYEDYALGLLGHAAQNNVYVVPTRMYDAPPSLSQTWKIIDPPAGAGV